MSGAKIYSVIESGVVVNRIMLSDEDAVAPDLLPGQSIVQSDAARIGDSYAAGVFTKTANSN